MKPTRDELAALAMQGILNACASPQYFDRINKIANTEPIQDFSEVVAEMAYQQADYMSIVSKNRWKIS